MSVIKSKVGLSLLILILVIGRVNTLKSALQDSILPHKVVQVQPIGVANVESDSPIIIAEGAFELSQTLPEEAENKLKDEAENKKENEAATNSLQEKSEEAVFYDPVTKQWIGISEFCSYTKKELMHFNGIGEKTAEAIIEYQKNNGVFKTPEDLMKVKGIGPKKLEKLMNLSNN